MTDNPYWARQHTRYMTGDGAEGRRNVVPQASAPDDREAAARAMLAALKLCREQYAERGIELKEITRAIAQAEAAGMGAPT